jgi:sec-independent protein translocase protein TatC
MTLTDHLTELRRRLIAVCAALMVVSAVAYLGADWLVHLLLAPTVGIEFIYLTPPELFLAYLRLSFAAGIVVTFPFTLAHVWLFVRPALTPVERSVTRFIFLGGTLLFCAGGLFAYSIMLPISLRFFLRFSSVGITPMFSFGSYVGYVFSLFIAFGFAFELPIVIVALVRLELLDIPALRAARAYVFITLLILSAMITPPDVVSQLMLSVPMMLLYELSLLFARVSRGRTRS